MLKTQGAMVSCWLFGNPSTTRNEVKQKITFRIVDSKFEKKTFKKKMKNSETLFYEKKIGSVESYAFDGNACLKIFCQKMKAEV